MCPALRGLHCSLLPEAPGTVPQCTLLASSEVRAVGRGRDVRRGALHGYVLVPPRRCPSFAAPVPFVLCVAVFRAALQPAALHQAEAQTAGDTGTSACKRLCERSSPRPSGEHHTIPRPRAHCAMSSASAAPASPKAAASASAPGGYSTPSKRGEAEVDASSGPALAVKKRRRACANASAEAPPAAAPVPARDVTCSVCLEPVAAGCKPVDCGHLLCHTCAHGLWCCPQCRAQMSRACPTCRGEVYYEELEGDKEADKIAIKCAKKSLGPTELAQWRQKKTDGLQLSKRNEQGSVQVMQLAIKEEREFEHAVIVSRSPSSRAICTCCSEQISCGTLRVHRNDGRFSHVTCHDMEAEMQEVCTGERIGLGEVHVSVETNIVDPKLMRPDPMEIKRSDPVQLRALRQKLTSAAGMSQWFCELPICALFGLHSSSLTYEPVRVRAYPPEQRKHLESGCRRTTGPRPGMACCRVNR